MQAHQYSPRTARDPHVQSGMRCAQPLLILAFPLRISPWFQGVGRQRPRHIAGAPTAVGDDGSFEAKTRVLLTGAGGAAAVSFIKAVADERFVIHAADMDPNAAGLYLVPAAQRHRLLAGADPHFVAHLLDLCRRHAIDVLVPTVDSELLGVAQARRRFRVGGRARPARIG